MIGPGRQKLAATSYRARKASDMWKEGEPDRKKVTFPGVDTDGRKAHRCPMVKVKLNHRELQKRSQKAKDGNYKIII